MRPAAQHASELHETKLILKLAYRACIAVQGDSSKEAEEYADILLENRDEDVLLFLIQVAYEFEYSSIMSYFFSNRSNTKMV